MRVPKEAGLGRATIRLSFGAWKAVQVAPANITVPLVEAKTKSKTVPEGRWPEPKIADSKELRRTLRHDGYIDGLAYTPDGRLLAVLEWRRKGKSENAIHLWDTGTGKARTTFLLGSKNSEPTSLAMDATGKTLALAAREVKMNSDGTRYEAWTAWTVTLWDIATGKVKAAFREEKPGSAVVLALDGDNLLVELHEGEPWEKRPWPCRLIRLAPRQGKKTVLYESRNRECDVASASLDGSHALLVLKPTSKTATTEVCLFDVKTGQTRPLSARRGSVSSAAFSADGKLVAVSGEHELRFWDVAAGRERSQLGERYTAFWKRPQNERLGRITTMRFSPDGKLLAMAHEVYDIPSRRDITEIVLWDFDAGAVRAILRGHTNSIFQMAFAPDGRTLATGGYDKTVKLWNINLKPLENFR